MKKIKFLLEYQCSPIWIYDCNGELINNGLTSALQIKIGNDISFMLENLQEKYDKLFEDSEVYFEYKGFKEENERMKFICEAKEIIELIKSKTYGEYIFEITTDLFKL